MKVKEIRENSTDEIEAQIIESERELLLLQVKKTVPDGTTQPLKIRTLRRAVARMHTVIREREIEKND